MYNIAIIIPSYEPDERLIELLKCLDSEGIGPIINVNDGSGSEYDGIFEKAAGIVARLAGNVINHEVYKGKGRTLKTAFQMCWINGLR